MNRRAMDSMILNLPVSTKQKENMSRLLLFQAVLRSHLYSKYTLLLYQKMFLHRQQQRRVTNYDL